MRPRPDKRPAKKRHNKKRIKKRTAKLKRALEIRSKGKTGHTPKVGLQSNLWTVTTFNGSGENSSRTRTAQLRMCLGPLASSLGVAKRRKVDQVWHQFEKEESDGGEPPDKPKRRHKKRTQTSARQEAYRAKSSQEEGSGGLGLEEGTAPGTLEPAFGEGADDISSGDDDSSSESEGGSNEELLEDSLFRDCSVAESCEERSSASRGTGSQSAYKVFLVSKQQLLAVLNPPGPLCLVGRARLSVLYGTLTVDGHVMTASGGGGGCGSSGLLVQSGFLCAPAYLHPIQLGLEPSMQQLRKELSRLGVADALDILLPHLTRTSAVVLLERAEQQWMASQLGDAAVKLLPRLKGHYLGLGFKLKKVQCRQPWRLPLAALTRRLTDVLVSPEHQVPRIVVCGRQNTGKSTLLRTLVNSLLNVRAEVMYLDCDPGQSEFTPSAALSLTRVTEPLLGAPFTHVRTPEKMYFLGHVSPASQPNSYSTAVSCLLEHYRQHFSSTPLVVNTMGWVGGIGLSLLVDVIRWTSPTDLIQLIPNNLPADAEDLPPLDPSVVDRVCGWRTVRGKCAGPKNFSCHHLPGGSWRARSQAKLKRDAMMLSYLGRNVVKNRTLIPFWLWSTAPYRVPWSLLAVHDCDDIAIKQDLLYVINGSVVALCVVPRESLLETSNKDYPKFVKGTGPYECLGYGLVRTVDPVEKVFYIFTPEPKDRLAQVNALITGDVHLPDAVLFSQAHMFKGKTVPCVERNVVSSDDGEEEQGEEVSEARIGDESDCEANQE